MELKESKNTFNLSEMNVKTLSIDNRPEILPSIKSSLHSSSVPSPPSDTSLDSSTNLNLNDTQVQKTTSSPSMWNKIGSIIGKITNKSTKNAKTGNESGEVSSVPETNEPSPGMARPGLSSVLGTNKLSVDVTFTPRSSGSLGALLHVSLPKGGHCLVPGRTIFAMSPSIVAESSWEGGLLQIAYRSLSGSAAKLQTVSAPTSPGEILLAPSVPADIHVLELDGTFAITLRASTHLAHSAGVRVKSFIQWPGFGSTGRIPFKSKWSWKSCPCYWRTLASAGIKTWRSLEPFLGPILLLGNQL